MLQLSFDTENYWSQHIRYSIVCISNKMAYKPRRKRNILLNTSTVVALPSGASDRKIVWVQVPSPAPETPLTYVKGSVNNEWEEASLRLLPIHYSLISIYCFCRITHQNYDAIVSESLKNLDKSWIFKYIFFVK